MTLLSPPIDPDALLQLDYLRPAGGELSRPVEHGDPAHAGPAAELPAAGRDDRPAACRRATGRKRRFIDSIETAHNLHIGTPINARNRRPAYPMRYGGGGPASPPENRACVADEV